MSETEEKPRIFSGLSLFGMIASVGAAVTSAYVASRLGVAGTMVGVAFGTVVSTVAATAYANALERGKDVAKTAATIPAKPGGDRRPGDPYTGTPATDAEHTDAILRDAPASNTPAIDDTQTISAVDPEAVSDPEDGDEDEPKRRLSWKVGLLWGGIVLAVSLALIFTYEATTGNGFGGQESPGIGRIVHSGSGEGSQNTPDQPSDGSAPTDAPQDDQDSEPTETAPPPQQPDPGGGPGGSGTDNQPQQPQQPQPDSGAE